MKKKKHRNKEGVLSYYCVEKLGNRIESTKGEGEVKEKVEEISDGGKEIRERVSRNINFEKLFFSSSVRISPCV